MIPEMPVFAEVFIRRFGEKYPMFWEFIARFGAEFVDNTVFSEIIHVFRETCLPTNYVCLATYFPEMIEWIWNFPEMHDPLPLLENHPSIWYGHQLSPNKFSS